MKLVFLCTSLAPGRDGVGDYVRQLAGACAQLGHVCLLVALHDRALPAATGLQQRAGEVRFSSALSWSRRAALLGSLLREFDPHWISWQIVPFGFHPKGLMPDGARALAAIARPWRNHVLLHELWVGLAEGERFQLRLLGALQRRKLLAFLTQLAPACMHTTNPTYQLALAHHGWPVAVLPLFGNMPVLPVEPSLATTELATVAAGKLPPGPRWTGVIFGTIHPQWKPEPTLAWLHRAAARAQRRLTLLAVGRIGVHGARMLEHLHATHPEVAVIDAGPQPSERVSHLLQAADFGIATHPWALIGKSGSAATMLEHGLPVLVPRDDWRLRWGELESPADPLLRRLRDLEPADFPAWLEQRRRPESRLPGIAAAFLEELDHALPGGALVA
ncbi:hypothetical protein [Opitutus terrae]|uniref:Glycosyltransferase subfamily 4-like N-terminal domain-containing protein n=1 Tax=Opitutus terrae (strain DSM 11246 / JCM 15787 / PB90-1) TaxID=452637 RepID=B1ZT77_OPITP|nr:hypothetical protein [Opitutus terrae]ACB76531.1 hypothetical protein Oter_3252 [Opitutus terrae PB90-1]